MLKTLVFSPKKSTGCPVVSRLKKYLRTRKHSSRMCTARLLTVSQHALPRGVPAMGVYLPWGVYLLGRVPARECICPGGCTCQGVYLPRGVDLPGGVPVQGGCTCLWGCTCPGTPPVNRMTDRCKNITFPYTSFAGGNENQKLYCFSFFVPS